MAIISVGSIGHSPGVTTTAVAMALRWPRPVILIEADLSSTSSVLSGRLRGQLPHRVGLTGLASAALHGELEPPLITTHSIELAPERRLVPGFSSVGAARGADLVWPSLARVLRSFDGAGPDILIDLGRFDDTGARLPLIKASTLVLVCTGASLPDIAATTAKIDSHSTRLHEISKSLEAVGVTDGLGVTIIDRAFDNYGALEIGRACGLRVLGSVPFAPEDAAWYSHGHPTRRRRRPLDSSYNRAVDALVRTVNESQVHQERHRQTPFARIGVK